MLTSTTKGTNGSCQSGTRQNCAERRTSAKMLLFTTAVEEGGVILKVCFNQLVVDSRILKKIIYEGFYNGGQKIKNTTIPYHKWTPQRAQALIISQGSAIRDA